MKHIQVEIVQRKMSEENSMEGNFQKDRGVGLLSKGELFRVTVWGSCFRGNYSEVIVPGAKVRGVIVLRRIS